MTSRYEGRPFLRLLECYVLWALSSLSESDRARLEAMTPKLRAPYKRLGTWQEIVAAKMDFPADCAAAIVRNLEDNKKRAAVQGVQLDPQQFAQFMADQWSS